MIVKKALCCLAGISLLLVFACGPKAVKPQAEMDTPEHHVSTGNKFLQAGKLDEALNEFGRAILLDPKYAPAHTGLGLVYGGQGAFEKAFDAMNKAEKYAANDSQKTDAQVGYIRLYTAGGEALDANWLNKAEGRFDKAVKLSPDNQEPYFYMGQAYTQAYRFSEAAIMYEKTLNLKGSLLGMADAAYARIQKIKRAMPGTTVGKKIALLDSITRADVAALFIEELKIDALFEKKTPKKFDTAFKSPEKEFQTGEYVKAAETTDIADHVLKADIEAVINHQIKGLQPYPDHTFQPYKEITRAEFAMMIEDILIKITGDESLATKFIGSESPFPDLRSDLPFFNSVMVCVTRNIMATINMATGEFVPQGLVPGVDALLSIRQLKVELDK